MTNSTYSDLLVLHENIFQEGCHYFSKRARRILRGARRAIFRQVFKAELYCSAKMCQKQNESNWETSVLHSFPKNGRFILNGMLNSFSQSLFAKLVNDSNIRSLDSRRTATFFFFYLCMIIFGSKNVLFLIGGRDQCKNYRWHKKGTIVSWFGPVGVLADWHW